MWGGLSEAKPAATEPKPKTMGFASLYPSYVWGRACRARSGGALRCGIYSSRSRASLADNAIAALADAAGAATAHAGLLDDRGRTVVVNRKSFSEIHFE